MVAVLLISRPAPANCDTVASKTITHWALAASEMPDRDSRLDVDASVPLQVVRPALTAKFSRLPVMVSLTLRFAAATPALSFRVIV